MLCYGIAVPLGYHATIYVLIFPGHWGDGGTGGVPSHEDESEILERWYGELEILKRLDHHNIVKAMNVQEGLNSLLMGNTPFICKEYCNGGDL